MSRSGLIFALFCLGVVALYFLAARSGYSPFARAGSGVGGGGGFFYAGGGRAGPQHK
ncbi:MAG: hypothetical protein JWN21_1544 [Sphingomonas bacterium]|uniref:hypothetical protein n=1 Tax=Sphingomonas bacterium TaxID=1895847 RepID=UPI002606DCD3|nr:hypothetical protein [Sphingomonas bacterium]MDB5696001.1 hypothetical protein [Sphingomonas bacterium]